MSLGFSRASGDRRCGRRDENVSLPLTSWDWIYFQETQRIPNFNLLNIIFTFHLHSLVHLIPDNSFKEEEKWTKGSWLLFISKPKQGSSVNVVAFCCCFHSSLFHSTCVLLLLLPPLPPIPLLLSHRTHLYFLTPL